MLVILAGAAVADPQQDVLAVLRDAEAGWNAGDLEAYMQGYWRSEDLRFASGNAVTTGWQATLDRYRARYTDRAALGRLAFTDLDATVLSADAALVFGRWTLHRAHDAPTGLFTLVFRRFEHGWRIVHDHTSAAPAP
jgi:ketosteroid isomerase-like protein